MILGQLDFLKKNAAPQRAQRLNYQTKAEFIEPKSFGG
jgi:hypothetical protein